MKRTKFRLRLCGVLIGLWLAVIWGNSLLPGEESSQVSGWVGAVLEMLLPFLDMEADSAMLILRKLGHFSEFAVLGALFSWLFGMLERKWWLSLLCSAAVACADETIQLFVSGRNGCLRDVLIDSAGALTAVLLVQGILWVMKPDSRHDPAESH